jgi:hypothetical protein
MLGVFALTLFTSATLLFMVEPMIGKMILPLLGGTPAVWNTCMVFFQAVLLAGYLYAHLTTSWLGPRKQAVLHLGVLLLPFLFLPLGVNRDLIRGGDQNPIPSLLLVLSLSVGLPMFVVSASAPLLQKWFSSTSHPAAHDPYFLYGASNLGSMLSLFAYPVLLEPHLRLAQQSFDWTLGYGALVALTTACAVFLWRWPAAQTSFSSPGSKADVPAGGFGWEDDHGGWTTAELDEGGATGQTLRGEVTWLRVLRWVGLAFVPSSLMLGATTYITTDIAAIPLLWVLPLGLYLLSFIIVFARVPAWVHQGMVLVMPLVVLLLVFLMLADITKLDIGWRVAIHLITLFVVAMVCHGELARDRPAPQYLTGYFLWMSVGGVLGGLFNGLFAPVAFNAIVEYQLALVLACLFLPPLGGIKTSVWGQRVDVLLACLFAGIGGLLFFLRYLDHDIPYQAVPDSPWPWGLVAALIGIGVGLFSALGATERKLDGWLDLLLPLCLGLLVFGLFWGLTSDTLWGRLKSIARGVHLEPEQLYMVLTVGVPAVMCYTFVERSFRFALGLGALLLTFGMSSELKTGILHQERSFYGVLRVEKAVESEGWKRYSWEGEKYRRLIHGTTMHGKQFLSDERRDEPLTYYHLSGPIGQLMTVYNHDPRHNLAVIGLGTGTMAAYALPGQHITFYDIDPVVRRLSFDEADPYFTYVNDARRRGAHVDLVMGDARLTMERQHLTEAEKYSLIVVDAFSSDAIPIHLITREALKVYLDKLTEAGLLAFHVSNRYLDLRPVLANLAQEAGLVGVYESDDQEQYPGKSTSTWVVLARKDDYLDGLRTLNNWEYWRSALQQAFWPFIGWPDYGSGLSGQALCLHAFLGEEVCKWQTDWRELLDLKPAGKEPGSKGDPWSSLEQVGVWSDDYSNLLSVFSW